MLSFDVSAIDMVLSVAMIVLFALFLAQKKSQPAAQPQLNTPGHDRPPGKPEAEAETKAEVYSKKQSAEGFQSCVHEFGYLKSVPKNSIIPDECFGCPKVLRCMFPSK